MHGSSLGTQCRIDLDRQPSKEQHEPSAAALAKSLQACRLALVSRAKAPINPSEAAINGIVFTPFVGVSTFGPAQPDLGPGGTIRWPRQSHPNALAPAGRERTPWLTSWARATFEQGILSVLPMLEGPCAATSLPGEHLFQASALPRNRVRPAIFHAFGKAKVGAQDALRDLERQGWETLPIAILGMPNLPPAWAVDTWKPVGGCKFTGYSSGTVCNSALRFCLLLKWRAVLPGNSDLFPRPDAEALFHTWHLTTETDHRQTVLSVDGIGAYDHVSRNAMLRGLANTPHAQAALPFARLFYSQPFTYLWTDDHGQTHPITQAEGGEQGDPLMPALFSLALDFALRAFQADLLPGERVMAFLDDIYITAPPPRIRPLFDSLSAHLLQHTHIQLHHGKTQIWNASGENPPTSAASARMPPTQFGSGTRRCLATNAVSESLASCWAPPPTCKQS